MIGLWAFGVSLSPGVAAEIVQAPPQGIVAATPFVRAVPNPVPTGTGLGVTTIEWDAAHDQSGEVLVSTNGGPLRVFASGRRGTLRAGWIEADATYVFRLYGDRPNIDLASIRVTRASRYNPITLGIWSARVFVALLLLRAIAGPRWSLLLKRQGS